MTATVSGLAACTTYHYRVFASNPDGSVSGSNQSFTTSGCLPDVTTLAASSINTDSVLLNGAVVPNGLETTVHFEWGLLGGYANTTPVAVYAGVDSVAFSAVVDGLSACTSYDFRAVAINADGSDTGENMTFLTAGCLPTAVTLAATSIGSGSANLNGQVNPNGLSTTSSFEWGVSAAYGNTTSPVDQGSGTSNTTFNTLLTGLDACTTYHYRATAFNIEGSDEGGDQSFTTLGCQFNQPPEASPIVSNLIDEDLVAPGVQLSTTVSGAIFSIDISDADGDGLTWQWSYRLDGGSENAWGAAGNKPDGSLETVNSVPFDLDEAEYQWIVRITDGVNPEVVRSIMVSVTDDSAPPPATLIEVGESWKYLKGTSLPPLGWQDAGFNDASWLEGPSGFGYSSDITYPTELTDMAGGGYLTFYLRKTFFIDENWTVSGLSLDASYDDGFIAYVNGVEVARSDSMQGQTDVTHLTPAAGSHDEQAGTESFNISAVLGGVLNVGINVLAIEVHNVDEISSDAGIVPVLRQTAVSGPDLTAPGVV